MFIYQVMFKWHFKVYLSFCKNYTHSSIGGYTLVFVHKGARWTGPNENWWYFRDYLMDRGIFDLEGVLWLYNCSQRESNYYL